MPFFHCECGMHGRQFKSIEPEIVNPIVSVSERAMVDFQDILKEVGINIVVVTQTDFIIKYDSITNLKGLQRLEAALKFALYQIKND